MYTGLEILAAMRRLNTRLKRERRVQLAVRLGIKRWRNEEARKMYIEEITPILEKIGLTVPDEHADRRVS